LHSAEKVNAEPILIAQGIEEILREGSMVYVNTGPHSRRRNLLCWIAPFHDEWEPFFDLHLVIGIFHSLDKGDEPSGLRSVLTVVGGWNACYHSIPPAVHLEAAI
jgi:hypothetical protein